ncbi:uncharacterized protein BDZ99DRAFT_576188 [Mytilinidion resinicola]|uniref:Uncharacterized protein n=1 Tax=Mytilinidion resinicola TaxID=574789 RepID=A0A6A6Y4W8_9PEZI|nr:uncharacterized protein BDZ99DRAFT_576188 [Mytilinidion resinicola]KAF2803275.1 hypothetical protein BDZ99DRAFT_576188 [Mytilinidion resinicola]
MPFFELPFTFPSPVPSLFANSNDEPQHSKPFNSSTPYTSPHHSYSTKHTPKKPPKPTMANPHPISFSPSSSSSTTTSSGSSYEIYEPPSPPGYEYAQHRRSSSTLQSQSSRRPSTLPSSPPSRHPSTLSQIPNVPPPGPAELHPALKAERRRSSGAAPTRRVSLPGIAPSKYSEYIYDTGGASTWETVVWWASQAALWAGAVVLAAVALVVLKELGGGVWGAVGEYRRSRGWGWGWGWGVGRIGSWKWWWSLVDVMGFGGRGKGDGLTRAERADLGFLPCWRGEGGRWVCK